MAASSVSAGHQAPIRFPVPPFERVELRDAAHDVLVVALPDDECSVEVTGEPRDVGRVRATVEDGTLFLRLAGRTSDRIRDAVTTSLTRRALAYTIRAPRLYEVRVAAFARVAVDAFGADAPAVTGLEPTPPLAARPPAPPRSPTAPR